MKGLDTNVLVRFVVGDDRVQQTRAKDYLQRHCTAEDPGFVNHIVLTEFVWVLERGYGYSRDAIRGVLEVLLGTSEIEVQDASLVRRALARFTEGADFADALIGEINLERGCSSTATFDDAAVKRLPSFRSV